MNSRNCFELNKKCIIEYTCPMCRDKNNIILNKNYLLNLNEIEGRFKFNVKNNLSNKLNIIGVKYYI